MAPSTPYITPEEACERDGPDWTVACTAPWRHSPDGDGNCVRCGIHQSITITDGEP